MLMLEVMRVDDHERPGDRKGFINPVHRRENDMLKDILLPKLMSRGINVDKIA